MARRIYLALHKTATGFAIFQSLRKGMIGLMDLAFSAVQVTLTCNCTTCETALMPAFVDEKQNNLLNGNKRGAGLKATASGASMRRRNVRQPMPSNYSLRAEGPIQ